MGPILIDYLRKRILDFTTVINRSRRNANDIQEIFKICDFFENILVLKIEIQKELEKLKDTLRKKFEGFINEVRQIFEINFPSINDLINKFKDFIEWNEDFTRSNHESIIWQGFDEFVNSFNFHQNLKKTMKNLNKLCKWIITFGRNYQRFFK